MEPSANGMSTYFVHYYDGVSINKRTVSREEVQAIRADTVDHFFDDPRRRFEFRRPDGAWIVHDGSHLGEVSLALLEVLQSHAGEYLSSCEIAKKTGHWTLHESNSALAQRFKWLRKIHRETPQDPWFFMTQRNGSFGISWSAARTWIRIERA